MSAGHAPSGWCNQRSTSAASIEELDLDEWDDEILIRVATAGMCHADIATRGLRLTVSRTSGGRTQLTQASREAATGDVR
jgi:hypothetical protein